MSKSKCQIKSKAPTTKNKRFGFLILDLVGYLKFGFRISQRGFTMIEVVVMLFIIVMVSGIVLANFPGISGNISAQKSAQRLALSLRRAQGQALAVREVSVDGEKIIAPAYGIYLQQAQPAKYLFFGDRNADLRYGMNDSVIETFTLAPGVSFTSFRDEDDQSLAVVSVAFRAPGGEMVISDAEGPVGESALISLRAGSDGVDRFVRIHTSGQITVE